MTVGISLENYIAFAVACRWIKSITFVLHPKWHNDLAWLLFKNFDSRSGAIELKCFEPGMIDELCDAGDLEAVKELAPTRVEPLVPFLQIPLPELTHTERFERALLCQSPNYTPRASDGLISVFADYIDFS